MTDQLYLKTHQKRLKQLESESLKDVKDFLADGAAYCSVSGGKDSFVAAYLCIHILPSIPLVHVFDSVTYNPCAIEAISEFESKFGVKIARLETRYNPKLDGTGTHDQFFLPAATSYGQRRIVGIRKDESVHRKYSASVHGISTKNVCRPLLKWSSQDVFAFCLSREIPISSVYAMSLAGTIPRNDLRTDVIGDANGRWSGRKEWEMTYFPDRHMAINRDKVISL